MMKRIVNNHNRLDIRSQSVYDDGHFLTLIAIERRKKKFVSASGDQ